MLLGIMNRVREIDHWESRIRRNPYTRNVDNIADYFIGKQTNSCAISRQALVPIDLRIKGLVPHGPSITFFENECFRGTKARRTDLANLAASRDEVVRNISPRKETGRWGHITNRRSYAAHVGSIKEAFGILCNQQLVHNALFSTAPPLQDAAPGDWGESITGSLNSLGSILVRPSYGTSRHIYELSVGREESAHNFIISEVYLHSSAVTQAPLYKVTYRAHVTELLHEKWSTADDLFRIILSLGENSTVRSMEAQSPMSDMFSGYGATLLDNLTGDLLADLEKTSWEYTEKLLGDWGVRRPEMLYWSIVDSVSRVWRDYNMKRTPRIGAEASGFEAHRYYIKCVIDLGDLLFLS